MCELRPETWLSVPAQGRGLVWPGRRRSARGTHEGLGAWGAAGAPRHELGGQAASFTLNMGLKTGPGRSQGCSERTLLLRPPRKENTRSLTAPALLRLHLPDGAWK